MLFADGTTERFQPFAAPDAQPERLFTMTFTKQIASVRAVSGGLVETRQPENCPPVRGPAGGPEAQPPLGAPEVPGALPRVDVPGPEVPEVLNVAEAGPFGLPRTGVAAKVLGLTGVALLVIGIGLIRAGSTGDASRRRPPATLPPTG